MGALIALGIAILFFGFIAGFLLCSRSKRRCGAPKDMYEVYEPENDPEKFKHNNETTSCFGLCKKSNKSEDDTTVDYGAEKIVYGLQCTNCGHVYDADTDGGEDKLPYHKQPDEWTCPGAGPAAAHRPASVIFGPGFIRYTVLAFVAAVVASCLW